jgi:hypothetical protein
LYQEAQTKRKNVRKAKLKKKEGLRRWIKHRRPEVLGK